MTNLKEALRIAEYAFSFDEDYSEADIKKAQADVQLAISELQKTMKSEEVDELIQDLKTRVHLEMDLKQDPQDESKYLFPFYDVDIEYRTYEATKRRNWGITCDCCKKKVSTKDSSDGIIEYFSMQHSPMMEMYSEIDSLWIKTCSKWCAKVAMKEIFLNWINANEYQKYFDMDKLDERSTEYIRENV